MAKLSNNEKVYEWIMTCVAARVALFCLVTSEEMRAENVLRKWMGESSLLRTVLSYTWGRGVKPTTPTTKKAKEAEDRAAPTELAASCTPTDALAFLETRPKTILILRDGWAELTQTEKGLRCLRDSVSRLAHQGSAAVFLTTQTAVPEELRGFVVQVILPPLDVRERGVLVDKAVRALREGFAKKSAIFPTVPQKDMIVAALAGCTAEECGNTLAICAAHDGKLTVKGVRETLCGLRGDYARLKSLKG